MNTAYYILGVVVILAILVHTSWYQKKRQSEKSKKEAKAYNRLLNLLNVIQEAANKQQSFDPKTGKMFWQPIKKLVDNTNRQLRWRQHSPRLLEQILSLSNRTPDHFLRQLIRIPNEENLTLRRLCQIALNIGQWEASWDEKIISKEEYNKHNLGSIHTYVACHAELCALAETLTTDSEKFIYNYCLETIQGKQPWESA